MSKDDMWDEIDHVHYYNKGECVRMGCGKKRPEKTMTGQEWYHRFLEEMGKELPINADTAEEEQIVTAWLAKADEAAYRASEIHC